MSVEVTTSRWWRPFDRADRVAIGVLVAVATLLFVVPALLGHPAIDADNLIQNFPLRVLVGRQLASGHLPLLDPLSNAGTPLLGGMNAGALYPLTIIFAFVPAIPAWLINMIAVYLTASLGVFVLLRWHGISTWPSLAAGLSYAYSGAMIGQMVHLGVVQGYSFVPWAVVIVLALSRRLEELGEASWREYARAAPRWMAAVALLWGLTFLTGEPRAIAVIELLFIILVPGVLLVRTSYWLSSWRARAAFAAILVVGFAWGLGLGLVQALPGWSYIHFSQRSAVSYWFFGAGSLAVRWTVLLLTPDLFGGNGNYGQQPFFAHYNLAEVTGYAGILALMAAAAFVTRLTRRGWRGAQRDYVLYAVTLVVGLLATWGNFTPVGHVFRAIPLFGSTRLQSRNVILVDFALAVLLGWWLQRVKDRAPRDAALAGPSRLVTALPATLLAVLSLALIVAGPWTIRHLAPGVPGTSLASHLQLINAFYLVLALLALVAVWALRDARRLFHFLLVVLVLDLVVFCAFSATGLIGGTGPREASHARAVSLLGAKGRFALVDNGGAHTGIYRVIGEPNMNVWTGLASVQGYGSLISTIYDDVTGTHPQTQLNPCHLAAGAFTQLRLSAVAIASGELSTLTSVPHPAALGCVEPRPSTTTHRYFGQLLRVARLNLAVLGSRAVDVRVRAINARGIAVGPTERARAGGERTFRFAARLSAGFVVTSSQPVTVTGAVVYLENSTGEGYSLNNPFQLAIDSSHWRLGATEDTFAVFRATTLKPTAWFLGSTPARVTSVRHSSWGDAWVGVTLRAPATLVRSEAYLPGWRATALNRSTGQSVELTVERHGLIQRVRVPAGKWTIHFHYHAPFIEVSVATSAVAVVLLLGAGVTWLVRRRRRSRVKVHA